MADLIKNVKSGIYNVIATGSVITADEAPVEIEFGNTTPPLKLTLNFVTNSTLNGVNIQSTPIDNHSLRFDLINFNSNLGGGNYIPIPIGSLNNRNLFFSFRTYTLDGSQGRTVIFTIYQV